MVDVLGGCKSHGRKREGGESKESDKETFFKFEDYNLIN